MEAETETAQMNGPSGKYIDSIDTEDPEYRRELQRPPDIKEDVRGLKLRQRVSLVLNSEAFREELEEIVDDTLQNVPSSSSLLALQQIADVLIPQQNKPVSGINKSGLATPLILINDLRGVDAANYSKQERVLRCKVASCYRLIDLFGWTHGIYNHISARINQEQEHFLINPFGLLYSEVTAGSLVKVNLQGEVMDQGNTTLGVNKAGFTIHSAIHAARPDIRCIIHLHVPCVAAVSMMKQGLLPISQEALICGEIAYHDYNGIVIDNEAQELIVRNLGPNSKVLFLRNHGAVACGATVEEAFHYAWNLIHACQVQVNAASLGIDNLIQLSEDVQQRTFEVASRGGGGVNSKDAGVKWRTGDLEFEALMRHLDSAGFRTGYMYKQPIVRQPKKGRINSDVEEPPSSTNISYIYDEHGTPIKQIIESKKKAQKTEWLNTPNIYHKQEIEEIGTPNPKKIIKWVEDSSSPQRGSYIKVENPNQFAPQGQDPKEFKQKQKNIRKGYYDEKITPGPQSRILEGVSWEEAERMKDADQSGTQDKVIIVGAASKGIIKRDQQHNAVVYRTPYTPNPFDNMSPEEIEAYKKEVEKKQKGDGDGEPGADTVDTDEGHREPTPPPTPEKKESAPVAASTPKVRTPSTPSTGTPTTPNRHHRPRGHSFETNIDDVFDERAPSTPRSARETNIDDVLDSPPKPKAVSTPRRAAEPPADFQRTSSARYPPRSPECEVEAGSPAKSDTMRSTDSAGDTLDERSSKEGSPTKEPTESPTKEKKKKKKLRLPSFSKKKKEKKEKEKHEKADKEKPTAQTATQSAV
ncbi:alpha-adducin isoform X2 [Lingula anatina]|uniref:Alpha-adducin isoform X2 n=1 Tax=Lingula anatina TaxID=7574 RepID=A0A1S3II41_LINAN|nr:alpha-adducin isoform X2 [Lingula anatina]|eukprot:XP_013397793.1 alpha-adducin isoform X2 [Lingula anatina]